MGGRGVVRAERARWTRAAHLADRLDVHRAEHLVHALDDHPHRLGHLLHLHGRLEARRDSIDPGREAEIVLRVRLSPNGILGVDSCPVVVVLL